MRIFLSVFSVGPIEKAIDTIWLQTAGVSHATYHKCDFVGDGVKRIMNKKNRDTLWVFIINEFSKTDGGALKAEEIISKMKPLFDDFAELLHLTSLTRILSSNEKAQALRLCRCLPKALRNIKSNKQIKTHMIEFELYQFIDQWGTIGMLNEEAFESIHAHMNTLRRRYVCVRNAVDRERLIKKCFDTMQATMASTQKLTDGRKRIYKSKVVPRVDASDIPEAS